MPRRSRSLLSRVTMETVEISRARRFSQGLMAFFEDSRPGRAPFLNAPPVVLWLIGVMLAFHAARVYAPGTLPDDIVEQYGLVPLRYAEAFSSGGVGLRDMFDLTAPFVGYLFLHGDFAHVGINSLWLLAFGPIVARRLKTV